MSSLPRTDVHKNLPLNTVVRGRIQGWDDPNSDARYVHDSEWIAGPLWKQEVPELEYWQYGVRRANRPDGTSGGVVMVDPDTIETVDTKKQSRRA